MGQEPNDLKEDPGYKWHFSRCMVHFIPKTLSNSRDFGPHVGSIISSSQNHWSKYRMCVLSKKKKALKRLKRWRVEEFSLVGINMVCILMIPIWMEKKEGLQPSPINHYKWKSILCHLTPMPTTQKTKTYYDSHSVSYTWNFHPLPITLTQSPTSNQYLN